MIPHLANTCAAMPQNPGKRKTSGGIARLFHLEKYLSHDVILSRHRVVKPRAPHFAATSGLRADRRLRLGVFYIPLCRTHDAAAHHYVPYHVPYEATSAFRIQELYSFSSSSLQTLCLFLQGISLSTQIIYQRMPLQSALTRQTCSKLTITPT